MKREFAPPPPPTSHVHAPGEDDSRPTYWLYSEEKGMDGPFSKKEARVIVKNNPGISFLACREGEGWQDSATRLAKKKKPFVSGQMMLAIILIVVLLGAWFWWQKQPRGAPMKPQETAPAPAKSVSAGAK